MQSTRPIDEKSTARLDEKSAIPSVINFIWVGGPIPKDYLANIQKIAKEGEAAGFKVNLWVDDEKNVYKTLNRLTPDILELPKAKTIVGAQIRNIKELIPMMKADPLFQTEDRYKEIMSYISREMIGFKNLAATSDWLRYLILYFEGGYYLDTDINLDFTHDVYNHFIPDTSALGFKVPNMYGSKNEVLGNNDIIASQPKHTIMKNALCIALNNCKLLDNTKISLSEAKKLQLSRHSFLMDSKRFPYSRIGNTSLSNEGRRMLTIYKSTGPTTLQQGIEKFFADHTDYDIHKSILQIVFNKDSLKNKQKYSELNQFLKENNITKDSLQEAVIEYLEIHHCSEESLAAICKYISFPSKENYWSNILACPRDVIAGVAYAEICHASWLKIPNKRISFFDTNDLPTEKHFSSSLSAGKNLK